MSDGAQRRRLAAGDPAGPVVPANDAELDEALEQEGRSAAAEAEARRDGGGIRRLALEQVKDAELPGGPDRRGRRGGLGVQAELDRALTRAP